MFVSFTYHCFFCFIIILGTFGAGATSPNVTVRSYSLTKIDNLKCSSCVLNAIEAFKVITASSKKNCFVYRLLSIFHSKNALHLILSVPVVADLDCLLRSKSDDNTVRTTKEGR